MMNSLYIHFFYKNTRLIFAKNLRTIPASEEEQSSNFQFKNKYLQSMKDVRTKSRNIDSVVYKIAASCLSFVADLRVISILLKS